MTIFLVLVSVFTFTGVSLSDDKPTTIDVEYEFLPPGHHPKRQTIKNEKGRYIINGDYIVDTKTGVVKNFKNQLGVPFDKMNNK